jgi:hypothetical protein
LQFQPAPLHRGALGLRRRAGGQGRAVQVDPIKSALKAPGTKRLKLIYDGPLSNFAFNFNLRRYIKDAAEKAVAAAEVELAEAFKERNIMNLLFKQKRTMTPKAGPAGYCPARHRHRRHAFSNPRVSS